MNLIMVTLFAAGVLRILSCVMKTVKHARPLICDTDTARLRMFIYPAIVFGSLFCTGILYAGSAVRFPLPGQYGEKAAIVYDDNGERIGQATVSMKKNDNDLVKIIVRIALDSGIKARMKADLKFSDDKKSLLLVFQETRTSNTEGHLINRMWVDHIRRKAVCINAKNEKLYINIPDDDRIVNVPLNLLLKTVAAGDKDRVGFQTLVCGDDIKLLDTDVERKATRTKTGIVETRYQFDLGLFLSVLATPFLPRISFWFESGYPNAWIGYRMPLYSNGPTVLVLRDDYSPEDL